MRVAFIFIIGCALAAVILCGIMGGQHPSEKQIRDSLLKQSLRLDIELKQLEIQKLKKTTP